MGHGSCIMGHCQYDFILELSRYRLCCKARLPARSLYLRIGTTEDGVKSEIQGIEEHGREDIA